MLLETLKQDLIASLKKGDKTRTETLRFLLAAVQNAAIAKYGNAAEKSVQEEDVLGVIRKQIKTHNESIEAFRKGNRSDLVQREQAQLAILEAYMPKQASDEELIKLLRPVVASGESNFGLLMGQAMKATAGKADGTRISALLKQLTSV